jgi:membrane protein required for colicin V production
MTVFDLIVLALIGASVVAGALRGLVRALLTGVGLVVGLVLAARGYDGAGVMLLTLGLIDSIGAAQAAGFLLITGLGLVAGFAAGRWVRGSLRRARLEWFDRALGAGFGLIRGFAVCSVLYLALTAFPVRLSSVEQARLSPILAEGARLISSLTSADVRSRFLEEYKGSAPDK